MKYYANKVQKEITMYFFKMFFKLLLIPIMIIIVGILNKEFYYNLLLFSLFFVVLPIESYLILSIMAREVKVCDDKIVLSLLRKEIEISKNSEIKIHIGRKKLMLLLKNGKVIIVPDPDGKRTKEMLEVYEKWKKEKTT